MLLNGRFAEFGKRIFGGYLRRYSQDGATFSLRNAEGQRLGSADILKQMVEADEVLDEEKIAVPKKALDAFATEYDALVKEADAAADYQDRYRRALAETENVRRRMQKQVEDTKQFVMQNFCKDLLEVADILNIAVDSFEKAEAAESGSTAASSAVSHDKLKGMREGVAMTKDILLKTFAKHGIQAIQPHGEKFDPNLHDALFEVPSEHSKHPPGHVNEVLKVGYRLHERPIRPAKVSVVKH